MTESNTFEDRIAEQLRVYAAPAARPPSREAVANAVEAARNAHSVQRRLGWPAGRSNRMNTYAKLIVAAAAVLVVAFAGFQLLPSSGGVGGEPTIGPSPSPSVLARGTFRVKGTPVELNATGGGDSVGGTMTVSGDAGETMFVVDLECARIAADGRILIAGETTEAAAWATKGTYSAIVIKPGSPAHGGFGFAEDASSANGCMGYLDEIIDRHFATAIGDGALEPIDGTVELRP